MENSKEPAFPASASWRDESPEVIQVVQEGLTKREYIATKVLAAIISSGNMVTWKSDTKGVVPLAIEYADELLKQLESK